MTFRAQIVLPFFTNLPSDVITNTLHFREVIPSEPLETVAEDLTPLIETFLISSYTLGGLAQYVRGDIAYVNWYDLTQPEPRIPVREPLDLTSVSSPSDLPTEVACVLSFHGAPVAGVPAGRRRGRIYLGGLAQSWMAAGSASTFPEFATGPRQAVQTAANTFMEAVQGVKDYRWVVRSTVANQDFDVVGGWVDNAPDTQRRRSVDSTSRLIWGG